MKNFFLLLLLGIISISFNACNFDRPLFDGTSCTSNCIILNGIVIDTIHDTPIGGVMVKFFNTDGGFYSFEQVIVTTHTDEDGKFSANFPVNLYAEDNSYFYTEISKDNYHPTSESTHKSFRIDSTDIDNSIDIQLKMFPLTDILLDFTNQSSINLTDFNYYCSTCVPRRGSAASFPSDTTINFVREVGIDVTTRISYFYKKEGVSFYTADTIMAEKMETYMYAAEIE